jgi:hypothetical protein
MFRAEIATFFLFTILSNIVQNVYVHNIPGIIIDLFTFLLVCPSGAFFSIVSWINCILLGLNKEIKAQCPKPDKCWGEIAKEKKAPDGQLQHNVTGPSHDVLSPDLRDRHPIQRHNARYAQYFLPLFNIVPR